MKCPACQTVFQAGASTPVIEQGAASAGARTQTVAATQEWARYGLDGPLPVTPQLFPATSPHGPDPLANHVVEDPGFAQVDVQRVRMERIARERKTQLQTEVDPLEKFHADEEQRQQKFERQQKSGYLSAFTLFEFEGRISRKKFWLGGLFSGLIMVAAVLVALGIYFLALYLLDIDLPNTKQRNADLTPLIPLFLITLVAGCLTIWVLFALLVKRMHDLGRAGSRLYLLLIPIIGQIWILIECGFHEGQKSTNTYGPDPLKG